MLKISFLKLAAETEIEIEYLFLLLFAHQKIYYLGVGHGRVYAFALVFAELAGILRDKSVGGRGLVPL